MPGGLRGIKDVGQSRGSSSGKALGIAKIAEIAKIENLNIPALEVKNRDLHTPSTYF
jgi:hypothetical protein